MAKQETLTLKQWTEVKSMYSLALEYEAEGKTDKYEKQILKINDYINKHRQF